MRLLARLNTGFVAAAVPLLFLPMAEDAYRLVQLAALSLGVVLISAWPAYPEKGSAPWRPGTWCVLAFFGWRLASHAAAGFTPQSPAWVAEQFLYLSLFFWALGAASRPGFIPLLSRGLLTGLVLGSLYGILQHFQEGVRAYASLGNPDFWGSFLALLLPLSLASWLAAPAAPWLRGLAGALLPALLLFSLLLSQTRAAWLGFLVSLPVLLVHQRAALQKSRVATFLLAGLAGVLVFSFPNPLNPSGLASAGRFLSSFSMGHAAATDRLFMNRVAADMAVRNPFLGVGPQNLASGFLAEQGKLLALPAFFHQPYLFTTVLHDDWLQVAAESGWPALGLLLLSLGLALGSLWKREDPLSGAMVAGLVGLSVSALFSFPLYVVPTAAFFWTFLGIAFSQPEAPAALPAEPGRWKKSLRTVPVFLSLAASALILRLLYSNTVLHQGINLELAGEPSRSLAYLDKAARLDPGDYRAWFHLGRAAGKLGDTSQAARYYSQALRLFPEYPDAWAGLGMELGKEGRLPAAEEACRKALSLNPRSREAWGNLGKVHYLRRRSTQAKADYRQGLSMDPSWTDGYFNLGAIYYNEGNTVEAARLFRAALALDPRHQGAAAGLEKISARGRSL